MNGDTDSPQPRAEVADSQGVQAGTGNSQANTFIGQYIDQRATAPAVPGPTATGPIVAGEIPQPAEAFQPRAGLLEALSASGPGVAVVRSVTGMRGVGKTQVAAAYARACIDARWRLVAWVNAADDAGVLDGLATVAARLGLGQEGAPLEETAALVRDRLNADGSRCLLVFDNVADLARLRSLLPAAGQAQVVVTTTSQAPGFGRLVPVDVFTEAEALTFLAERTGRDDEPGARAVAEELGFLPLALAQAGAVIAAQHLSYPVYLERLRSVPVRRYLTPVQHDAYPHGVAEAVLLSLDAVATADQTGLCTGVLDVVAVLPPTGVPRALLYAAGEAGLLAPADRAGRPVDADGAVGAAAGDDGTAVDAVAVDGALARLADGSLLTFSGDDEVVSAHRLVTRVIRERRVHQGTLSELGQRVCALLSAAGASLGEPWRNRVATRELIGQVTALYQHLSLAPGQSELTAALLPLRGDALRSMLELGDTITQAVQAALALLADCERVLDADHLDTLTARSNLATAYAHQGRMADAIPLFEQTLADSARLLGADHPDMLSSRNNLASAYVEQGRMAEAIPLFEQTLAGCARLLGADHPGTLTSRNNLASAYEGVGRVSEALPLFELNLAEREQVLGADHPGTLSSRRNLAVAYDKAGRVAEALPLFELNLADSERVLGADHPDTLSARNNLAYAYALAGRTSEALPLFEQALDGCERVLGSDHRITMLVQANLAKVKGQCAAGGAGR